MSESFQTLCMECDKEYEITFDPMVVTDGGRVCEWLVDAEMFADDDFGVCPHCRHRPTVGHMEGLLQDVVEIQNLGPELERQERFRAEGKE